MKYPVLIALVVSVVFSSCNPNKPKEKAIEVFENVDSTSIANDTVTEKAIESSYEYAKSLPVSEKLVYDVIAYGGPPSHGEYAILRRGANNKADTVFRAERFGIIVNTFTADLNQNGKEEVYIVMRRANAKGNSQITAIEFDKNGIATHLIFSDSAKDHIIYTPEMLKEMDWLTDTVFIDGPRLVKTWDYYKKHTPRGEIRVYRLKNNEFYIDSRDNNVWKNALR